MVLSVFTQIQIQMNGLQQVLDAVENTGPSFPLACSEAHVTQQLKVRMSNSVRKLSLKALTSLAGVAHWLSISPCTERH